MFLPENQLLILFQLCIIMCLSLCDKLVILTSSSRLNETTLLRQAKDYTSDLEKQRAELEKGDNFPESSNTEVTKLREQFLKYNNDLVETEERQYQLEYKLER